MQGECAVSNNFANDGPQCGRNWLRKKLGPIRTTYGTYNNRLAYVIGASTGQPDERLSILASVRVAVPVSMSRQPFDVPGALCASRMTSSLALIQH